MEIFKEKYWTKAELGLGYVEIQNDGSQIRLINLVNDEEVFIDTRLDSLVNFKNALELVINNLIQ